MKITLAKADLEEFEASRASKMPKNLLITYRRDEILDLAACVQSGGRPDDVVLASKKIDLVATVAR